jgi:hypothetical protein
MNRVHEDYLRDMLENAEKALSFVDGMDYDDFETDDKAVYAVIRAFEIIGEAARQIPENIVVVTKLVGENWELVNRRTAYQLSFELKPRADWQPDCLSVVHYWFYTPEHVLPCFSIFQ